MKLSFAILLLSVVCLAQNETPNLKPEGAMFRMVYLPSSTANWKADTQEVMRGGLINPQSCIYVDVDLDSLNLEKPPSAQRKGIQGVYLVSEWSDARPGAGLEMAVALVDQLMM